jgi:hypothetical protein
MQGRTAKRARRSVPETSSKLELDLPKSREMGDPFPETLATVRVERVVGAALRLSGRSRSSQSGQAVCRGTGYDSVRPGSLRSGTESGHATLGDGELMRAAATTARCVASADVTDALFTWR